MQYTALVLAALSATAALPGPRGGRHHHHRRHAEAAPEAEAGNYDVSNVDWTKALANVNWANVFGGSAAGTTTTVQNAGSATTTVAVVGVQSPAAATTTAPAAAATTTAAAASAGNVLVARPVLAAASSSSSPAAAAASPASTPAAATGDDYTVQVVNNCGYTIWQAGWQTNTAGALISSAVKGNEMAAGSSLSLAIPKAALGVQLWARTGCTGSGSSFHCAVGDCQGLQCSSIIWQGGPIMAEFGSGLNTDMYNTGITAYDISAIPGNNCGVKIVPSKSSCETKYCPLSGCAHDQAWLSADDMSLGSPADTTCSNDTNFTVTFCPA